MKGGGGARVFVLGATGAIGRATVAALTARGADVACFVRDRDYAAEGVELRYGDATDPTSLRRDGLRGERFDGVVSCLASRTGAPDDAWAIDHRAHMDALAAAEDAGIGHFVLLSAICVQKPMLAFQQAKLAFEEALIASDMRHSIIRPTAFFKSLSGQVERVRAGAPFMVFGDGRLTACKPISDSDLGDYIAGCLEDEARWNRVLPIGGPGPAITPRDQGLALAEMLGREPKFRSIPVAMMDAIIGGLRLGGVVSRKLAAKAEFAKIGRYYGTESMLVWNEAEGRYDADATPEYGADTLFEHYERLLSGEATTALGDHAVFGRRRV